MAWQRVALEKRRQDTDGALGIADTYEQVAEAYVEIKATYGSTYLDSMQIGEKITHRGTIRWRPVLDFDHLSYETSAGRQRFRLQRQGDERGDRRWVTLHLEELTPEPRS